MPERRGTSLGDLGVPIGGKSETVCASCAESGSRVFADAELLEIADRRAAE